MHLRPGQQEHGAHLGSCEHGGAHAAACCCWQTVGGGGGGRCALPPRPPLAPWASRALPIARRRARGSTDYYPLSAAVQPTSARRCRSVCLTQTVGGVALCRCVRSRCAWRAAACRQPSRGLGRSSTTRPRPIAPRASVTATSWCVPSPPRDSVRRAKFAKAPDEHMQNQTRGVELSSPLFKNSVSYLVLQSTMLSSELFDASILQ